VTPIVVGIIGLVVMMVLLAIRVPVGLSMIWVSMAGYAFIVSPNAALVRLGTDPFQEAATFGLSVIPAFVLMGYLLANAGLADDIFSAINGLIPRVRGGLAVTTILSGGVLASVVGSGLAATATISSVAVPEMRRYGYDPGFAAASAAAGGTLGLLIPPSALLIFYGILTEESIGRVLVAGILPGILAMSLLMLTAWLVALRRPHLAPLVSEVTQGAGSPAADPPSPDVAAAVDPPKPSGRAFLALVAVFTLFIASIGGIYLGLFTPTEAGGVGAALATLLSFTLGQLGWRGFYQALRETARLTSIVFLVIIGGKMLGFFLAVTGIPTSLATFIEARALPVAVVLGLIFVVYFVMGALMDELAILVIMTPITYPIVVTQLGFDGVWFGILTMMMLLTGLLTPPIGLLVFVVSGITKVPSGTIYRAVTPYWIALVVAILIVMVFPRTALVLPELMR
jgi:tripartite ATP-independent transporter DctM subunit